MNFYTYIWLAYWSCDKKITVYSEIGVLMVRFLIIAALLVLSFRSYASGLGGYEVKNGVVFVHQEAVSAACLAQLMTELNGDNIISGVFLDRNSLRGCMASNIPHPHMDSSRFSYTLNRELESDVYEMTVCQHFSEGTLGRSCDQIIVEFVSRVYVMPEKDLAVVEVRKLGEW